MHCSSRLTLGITCNDIKGTEGFQPLQTIVTQTIFFSFALLSPRRIQYLYILFKLPYSKNFKM